MKKLKVAFGYDNYNNRHECYGITNNKKFLFVHEAKHIRYIIDNFDRLAKEAVLNKNSEGDSLWVTNPKGSLFFMSEEDIKNSRFQFVRDLTSIYLRKRPLICIL